MAARKKSLTDFVRDRTFLGRRSAELLQSEPLVRDPVLREIQKRYRRRTAPAERDAIALEFQLAAGLGLHALVSATDAPEVYGIAGSKEQASIAHRFADRWCEEGVLVDWVRPGRTIVCPERHGFYKVLSSDGRLGQGVQPSAGV